MATSSVSRADIGDALSKARTLTALLEAYDGTSASHLSLLKHTNHIRAALEEPYDIGIRWLDNFSAAAALYVLIQIKAFENIPEEASVTATELVGKCKVDVSVITRATRVLVVNGIFDEVGSDEYSHNELSRAFAPTRLGGFVCLLGDFMGVWSAFPNYVKSHKPEDLYDTKKSPFAYSRGYERKSCYEVLNLDPERRMQFNVAMQYLNKDFPVLDMFPFRELEDFVRKEPDRPFIVDVGGGRGQALVEIRKHCGGSFGGKLILQDLPIVINTLRAEDVPGIELMAYDIFTPQPVKSKLPLHAVHTYFVWNC
ncbi:hypothetical protein JDV02_009011 [Purpureocillium takamizusanense]|uniref:O-methyltransferase dimerisation domain-containing protein n=1 Tax=Purpureocillium takamizusanense TaxID=2060973 RepID=A0A9Q8QQT4_9HYPO|nr:uncharacterized protein JDV02_009011 [Purpureocillium takamizusanense]UNI23176.1 hypothetical protein JDV02_009011 [Purpureocillium takamizusanense]